LNKLIVQPGGSSARAMATAQPAATAKTQTRKQSFID
jgi:hypothetical protein